MRGCVCSSAVNAVGCRSSDVKRWTRMCSKVTSFMNEWFNDGWPLAEIISLPFVGCSVLYCLTTVWNWVVGV